MKRTTVFLTAELERLLQEAAKRTQRPQAEVLREALAQYLSRQQRPWPASIGMGRDTDEVNAENVKDWVREQWRRKASDDAEK